MENKTISELAAYVRNHVDNYEEYLWCLDNNVDYEDWDFDELIEGDDGFIWEE